MSGSSGMGETDTGGIRPAAHGVISPFYLDKIPQYTRAPGDMG